VYFRNNLFFFLESSCAWCKRAASDLKRCGNCRVTLYCSAECQKKDWKEGKHKKTCPGKDQNCTKYNCNSAWSIINPKIVLDNSDVNFIRCAYFNSMKLTTIVLIRYKMYVALNGIASIETKLTRFYFFLTGSLTVITESRANLTDCMILPKKQMILNLNLWHLDVSYECKDSKALQIDQIYRDFIFIKLSLKKQIHISHLKINLR